MGTGISPSPKVVYPRSRLVSPLDATGQGETRDASRRGAMRGKNHCTVHPASLDHMAARAWKSAQQPDATWFLNMQLACEGLDSLDSTVEIILVAVAARTWIECALVPHP